MNDDLHAVSADRRFEIATALAEIYQGLAEALAWPPVDWLAGSGREWPLWNAVVALAAATDSPAWQGAALKLAEVPKAGLKRRRQEAERIYHPEGEAPLPLYACQVLDGRFPGPTTFTIKRVYEKAGLEVAGAEMPDHIAVELAFLGWVCEMESHGDETEAEWRALRRAFIQNHASRWMPQVARALQTSGLEAWEALGAVLAASLTLSPVRRARRRESPTAEQRALPYIPQAEACTLCGFCVQVCPTKALRIQEDEAHTELWLQAAQCIGCHRCERVCDPQALKFVAGAGGEATLLRRSPRARCPRCGAPTVSQAELTAVAAMLGEHPAWLDTCLNCR